MGKYTVLFEIDYAGDVSSLAKNIESLTGVKTALTDDADRSEEVDMKIEFDVTFDRSLTDETEIKRGIEEIHRVWEVNL